MRETKFLQDFATKKNNKKLQSIFSYFKKNIHCTMEKNTENPYFETSSTPLWIAEYNGMDFARISAFVRHFLLHQGLRRIPLNIIKEYLGTF